MVVELLAQADVEQTSIMVFYWLDMEKTQIKISGYLKTLGELVGVIKVISRF